MHVLHLITGLKVGGAENALYNFLKYATTHRPGEVKHTVAYFRSGPLVSCIESLGVETYHIRGSISPYDPLAWFRLFRLVRMLNPDLLHSALWSANIVARFTSCFCRVPLVSDLHSDCKHHGFVRNLLERFLLGGPKMFVAVAPAIAQSFISVFGSKKYVCERVTVICNGINPDDEMTQSDNAPLLRRDLGFEESDFIIGTVGRLHSIKRQDLLIRSFAKFLHACSEGSTPKGLGTPRLCIVGDGPERKRLEHLVVALGLQNHVIFTGEQRDVYRYYWLFDCFVLSSKSEGLSIALLEAMSKGLPIVTTGVYGEHDVITDGKHGFVVSGEREEDFVAAFMRLYTNDELRERIYDANVALVKKKFHIRNVVNAYYELYEKFAKLRC